MEKRPRWNKGGVFLNMTIPGIIKRMGLDLSPLGFLPVDGAGTRYFCTPVGAKVFGRTGVDGVHFCTVKALGETVFAVMPASEPGKYVLPVAKNFEEFFGILISVGDAALFETMLFSSRGEFEARTGNVGSSREKSALSDRLVQKFGIKPVSDPYACVQSLEREFDVSQIKFGRDYALWAPVPEELPKEWKVCWGGGFGCVKGRSATELALGAVVKTGERIWYIPSVYTCSSGMIVDVFTEIPSERVSAFWSEYGGLNEESLSPDQIDAITEKDPVRLEYSLEMVINGRQATEKYSYGELWLPCELVGTDNFESRHASRVLNRYGFDTAKCWSIRRFGIGWATAKKPVINSLLARICFDKVCRTVGRFILSQGDKLTVTNPFTENEHQLEVVELKQETLPENAFGGGLVCPKNFASLTYVLSPSAERDGFELRDDNSGDRPYSTEERPKYAPVAEYDAAIGIIGGADGPTVLVLGAKQESQNLVTAVSSLYFESPGRITWKAVFKGKTEQDIQVKLV